MNVFERYAIPHLSPSTCNTFAASPAMFVLTKVLKKTSSVGASAHRGTAVEAGVTAGLIDPGAPLKDCVQVAMDKFQMLTALSADPRADKERDAIPGFVESGLKELRPYGVPTSVQGLLSLQVEGLQVPIIGYYDFLFGDILIDLKTTHAVPSKITNSHARQVALYSAALGKDILPRLSYVSSKKASTLVLENVESHVKALTKIALAMQNFLSVSEDPMELASIVAPDVDSFFFSDPITRQAAFDVWGV